MHFFEFSMLAGGQKVQQIFAGDSITYGIGTTGYGASGSGIQGLYSYPQQVIAALNNSQITPFKLGYPGIRTDNYMSGPMAANLALVDRVIYRKRIVVLFFGANDLPSSNTAIAVYNNLVAIHAAWRASGCKTVAVTVMNRQDNVGNVDPKRQEINTLIRGNWQLFADDIADLSEDTDLDSINAPLNPLYFAVNDADGRSAVHPTDLGAGRIATLVIKPIQRLMGSEFI